MIVYSPKNKIIWIKKNKSSGTNSGIDEENTLTTTQFLNYARKIIKQHLCC
jgi:hypothetical protein